MGASSSKTLVKVINESITEVAIKAVSTTVSVVTGDQDIVLSGKVKDSTFSQDASVNIQSLQKVVIDIDMIEKIMNEIKSKAKASGDLGTYTSAKTDTEIRNILYTNLSMDTIQVCAASVNLTQNITVTPSGDVDGVQVNQIAANLSNCKQLQTISTKIAKDFGADVTSESDAETKGLAALLKALMDGLTGPIKFIAMMVVGFFMLIIILALIMVFKGGSSQPDFQPGFQQPGFQQPGFQQPGFQQPGFQQPGYQPPGYRQPGYQQQPNVRPIQGNVFYPNM